MTVHEVNFDGLVGPTHHYGGLAAGNVASLQHRHQVSHPKEAALQGLEKMKLLADLGLKQAVLPPHPRPCFDFLRRQGFDGPPAKVVSDVSRKRPELLSVAYSAAPMWAANMATVSPSMDTADGRVHLTPANLISTPHRALEPKFSLHILRLIFSDPRRFVVHVPLPDNDHYSDEGAANHTRLAPSHTSPAIELFTYGRDDSDPSSPRPQHYPARQSRLASEEISRNHQLEGRQVQFVQQLPEAIDAGVFHNDVIAVGNENVLLCHEKAYYSQSDLLKKLARQFPGELFIIEVSESELSLREAVGTYLFNSQLLTLSEGRMLLLCPGECAEHKHARQVIDRILAAPNPIAEVRFVDVRQSMQNGGGPACLRLRVVLTETELAAIHSSVLLTENLYERLKSWIGRNYRDRLSPSDLSDPQLVDETATALNELSEILDLGPIYQQPYQ